ncbi:hypothetical protein CI109_102624 [Kwoniella shandongensis]|uniref:Uncharacterized protein n=1 Tax=Kwoniella shandongensis TaxID=1734106 RepID=A0AAJ8MW35_9TREE
MTRFFLVAYVLALAIPTTLGRPLFKPRDLGYSVDANSQRDIRREDIHVQADEDTPTPTRPTETIVHVAVDISTYKSPHQEQTSDEQRLSVLRSLRSLAPKIKTPIIHDL